MRAPTGAAAANATMIDRQMQHMARLVDDLLDVSRITRGQDQLRSEPVEIARSWPSAVERAQPADRAARHELDLDVPRRARWCHADPARLAQVVAQPAHNAAKYTERGPDITRSRGARRSEATCVVRVRDNGIGIAARLLPRVFDLFVQGEQRSTAPRAARHRPDLVQAAWWSCTAGRRRPQRAGPGKGSEFVVRLPAGWKPRRRTRPPSRGPARAPRPRPGACWWSMTTRTRPTALASLLA